MDRYVAALPRGRAWHYEVLDPVTDLRGRRMSVCGTCDRESQRGDHGGETNDLHDQDLR
jgi:hypothetical protein